MDNVKSFVNKCIVNQNDIYLYFEMFRQLKPSKVIDIGMFLKRIGAVSRQAVSSEIGADVKLFGIDVMPECGVGVYSTIYDRIWSVGGFAGMEEAMEETIEKTMEKTYDLAFMLRTDKCLSISEESGIVSRIAKEASYLVVDDDGYERNKGLLAFRGYRELVLDNDRYKLVILE